MNLNQCGIDPRKKRSYHMMKRRTYAILLALALSVSLLTACGGNSGESGSSQSGANSSTSQTEEQPDASLPDASTPDASTPDASAPDASTPDSSAPQDEPVEEPQAQASLALDSNDFTLFSAGSSHTLKATVTPAGQKVTFTSGNEKVATVDQNGKVTAVAPGTAKITATAGDLTATCIVRCRWEEQAPSTDGSSSSSGSQNPGSSAQETPSQPETPAEPQVDLSAFYTDVTSRYEFGMLTLADASLAEGAYPGLYGIATKQCLPYINMMTMNTSEIVLVEVTNSSDVDAVKAILQGRIDAQVEGGAWYPSAIEVWQNNSRVVSNGNYVMMIVNPECDSIVSDFNALF